VKQSLRLTVVGLNFHPEQVGIGVYTTDMCRFIAKRGHDVTVVTGFPFYPEMRAHERYRGRRAFTEVIDGMTVHRCWTVVPRTWTGAARIRQELVFSAAAAARLATLRRPDVLVAVAPLLGAAVAAGVISRVRGVPLAVHVQDLQVDAAAGLGIVRNRLLLRALERAERWLYGTADAVTALDEPMRARILAKGVPADRVGVFPNWVDHAPAPDPAGAAAFRAEHGLEDRFLVVYSGSMGVKHGLRLVLDVAAGADDPGVRFLLIGDGVERPHLEREARVRGLNNVTFLPLQPLARMPAVLSATDLSLIPQRPEVRDRVVPSKLLRVLAGGVPILAATHADSGLAEVVRASGAGEVVAPGDAAGVWQAVRELKRCPERRREMARLGQAYAARTFGREAVLSAYVDRLEALARREPAAMGA
jgi:colanic acid biosynthesis glycosyl transferase WcaI